MVVVDIAVEADFALVVVVVGMNTDEVVEPEMRNIVVVRLAC